MGGSFAGYARRTASVAFLARRGGAIWQHLPVIYIPLPPPVAGRLARPVQLIRVWSFDGQPERQHPLQSARWMSHESRLVMDEVKDQV